MRPDSALTRNLDPANPGGEALRGRGGPACPCCGAVGCTDVGPIAAGQYFAGRRLDEPLPGGRLYRCSACSLCFRHPRPGEEQLAALYRGGTADNWESAPRSRTDWRIANRWIRERMSAGSILDVGCSSGGMLLELGSPYARFGIEMNPEAARVAEARGVTVVGSDFSALPGLRGRMDATVAIDVLEHAGNPLELLRAMAETTRPGGLVIVSTGNTDARSWKLLGSRYWYCTIPEHLTFINPRWCHWAAGRLGMRLEHVQQFSHAGAAPLRQRVAEVARNLLFWSAPGMVATLRRRGIGGVDASCNPALALSPPVWITARDHLIACFLRS